METKWASENLQVIRTLMERSALYRRALAPIMTWAGCCGIVAAIIGNSAHLESAQQFAIYWLAVSCVTSIGAFLLVRRQALKDAEPFWSPPTRRVAQAALPAFFLGGVLSMLFVWQAGADTVQMTLPPIWMALYGCALHAAGFFMQRGIRLLGWLFVITGSALIYAIVGSDEDLTVSAHTLMGIAFGGFHLAYGIYLYLTEKRKNAA
ncbi:MAG: hypothetical protein JWM68_4099 [Verrucomicrobiales bacterium]|nr:hypothetical protein [Verrucomicrobiales bacterium]